MSNLIKEMSYKIQEIILRDSHSSLHLSDLPD